MTQQLKKSCRFRLQQWANSVWNQEWGNWVWNQLCWPQMGTRAAGSQSVCEWDGQHIHPLTFAEADCVLMCLPQVLRRWFLITITIHPPPKTIHAALRSSSTTQKNNFSTQKSYLFTHLGFIQNGILRHIGGSNLLCDTSCLSVLDVCFSELKHKAVYYWSSPDKQT